MNRRKGMAAGGILMAVVLSGCGGGALPPCDAPERRARATQVQPMSSRLQDSIRQAFTTRSRIQQVTLEQEACHFRATVRVDSFTTHQYAWKQGFELVRVLKENAPNETPPFIKEPAGDVGLGLYDYTVTFEQSGARRDASSSQTDSSQTDSSQTDSSQTERTPWLRIVKPYDERRISVNLGGSLRR